MNIDEATGSGHDLGQLLDARVMAMTLGLGLLKELMNIDEVTGGGHDLGQWQGRRDCILRAGVSLSPR